jgi:hypothetical protein
MKWTLRLAGVVAFGVACKPATDDSARTKPRSVD